MLIYSKTMSWLKEYIWQWLNISFFLWTIFARKHCGVTVMFLHKVILIVFFWFLGKWFLFLKNLKKIFCSTLGNWKVFLHLLNFFVINVFFFFSFSSCSWQVSCQSYVQLVKQSVSLCISMKVFQTKFTY